jgi:hypothetical protein
MTANKIDSPLQQRPNNANLHVHLKVTFKATLVQEQGHF